MPLPAIPALAAWALGALGAAAIVRLLAREYRRANDELDRVRRPQGGETVGQAARPTLRRDPRTGIYRP